MKKLIILILLLNCIALSSCKKSIEYKYVGAYIEIIDVETPDISDRNPKIYYNELTKQLIDTKQIYEYQIVTSSINKNIYEKNETMIYDIGCLYTLSTSSNNEIDQVIIYPIIYDGSKYQIKEDKKTLSLKNNETSSVSLRYTYLYQKKEYQFKTTIKILKKEV